MSPNPDSMSTKHRGSRLKTHRRVSEKQPKGKLVSAEVYPHSKPGDVPAREERIRVAAYLLAEQRGFAPGREVADWLAAAAEIDRPMAIEVPAGVLG
jgi:hypothetical protein